MGFHKVTIMAYHCHTNGLVECLVEHSLGCWQKVRRDWM